MPPTHASNPTYSSSTRFGATPDYDPALCRKSKTGEPIADPRAAHLVDCPDCIAAQTEPAPVIHMEHWDQPRADERQPAALVETLCGIYLSPDVTTTRYSATTCRNCRRTDYFRS